MTILMTTIFTIIILITILSWIDPIVLRVMQNKEHNNRMIYDAQYRKNYEYAEILMEDLKKLQHQ